MPSQHGNIVLAFDVYGTLLSTDSIAKKLASHCGEEKAKTIATTWRKYQLEYSWRMTSMGVYNGFDVVTQRSLRHALAESGFSLDEAEIKDVMKAYDSLSTFPDVPPTLQKLAGMQDVKVVAFSNGTHDMVSSSINNSADLSLLAHTFHDIVVVEECRKYKPAAEVYWHLAKRMGKDQDNAKEMSDMWLVSGNPFDVVGARAVGMQAIWVDRAGNGWQDQMAMSPRQQPSEIVRSLEEVTGVITKAYGS